MNLPSKRFAAQMRFLHTQRIPVVSLEAVRDFLYHGGSLPPRSVVITIDDGYRTAKTIAWPILKSYGFPFTVFLYTRAQTGHSNALSWSDIQTMSKDGVDFQSHTYSHPVLIRRPKDVLATGERLWLEKELVEPREEIRKHTGKEVFALAYPYGAYNEKIMGMVSHAGYDLALTCDEGVISKGSAPFRLHRRLVYPTSNWAHFVRTLFEDPLEVDQVSPAPGSSAVRPHRIRGRLKNPDLARRDGLRLFLDCGEKSWKNVPFNRYTGHFQFDMPVPHKRGICYATLLSGSRRESWLFDVKN